MEFADLAAGTGAIARPWWFGAGFLLGAIIGSYLATLAIRLPAGRSGRGRSRCDACDAPLRWWELAPLVSFALLGGRCRRCGAAIDRRHPGIELAAALIGALALGLHPGWAGIGGAIFGWMLLLLAVLDTEHFWLPDRLTLPLIGLGLATGLVVASPSLADRAIGAAAGYLALSAIGLAYRCLAGRTGLGGGDAKLLAGIGAWLGWQLLPLVVLAGSLTGLASVAVRVARGEAIGRKTRLPLGALLAVAAWPLWVAADRLRTAFGL